jgi:hypothetical protein
MWLMSAEVLLTAFFSFEACLLKIVVFDFLCLALFGTTKPAIGVLWFKEALAPVVVSYNFILEFV